jgi:hypothetical protein
LDSDSESLWKKMIGKPYSGKLNVRFDEGELEIGHLPLRQFSTLPGVTLHGRRCDPFLKYHFFRTTASSLTSAMNHVSLPKNCFAFCKPTTCRKSVLWHSFMCSVRLGVHLSSRQLVLALSFGYSQWLYLLQPYQRVES